LFVLSEQNAILTSLVRAERVGLIEQAMVFALGFLVAGLAALVIAPAFWLRAVRLSTRRLEMQVPLSIREILAQRDLLRAEFAADRRRLEQKLAALNLIHANNLSELGRRTTLLVEKETALASLGLRHLEQNVELSATQRTLAEALAESAATATALYGQSGLVERKNADLLELQFALATVRAEAIGQSAALADLHTSLAAEQEKLAMETAEVARLQDELVSLRLEHEADKAILKAITAKLADREDAIKAAENREIDLNQRRERQIETNRAAERRLVEKIMRLRSSEAAARDALEGARTNCDSLAREVAALRRAIAAQDAGPHAVEREENAILRQNINEIGAAIIRMANSGPGRDQASAQSEPQGEDESVDEAIERPGRALAKASGGAASK
jgi:hypothetical protein